VDVVMEGLAQAMSWRKLGFFMLGQLIIQIITLLVLLFAKASIETFLVMVPVVIVLVIGLSGVLAGGVSYMTHARGQGRAESIRETFRFLTQRFLSLFGGTLLLAFLLILLLGLINGLVAFLNKNPTIGSFLGALLFIPQAIANLAVVLTFLVGVLVPCAVAVENIGAGQALTRLVTCVRRYSAPLMVYVGVTSLFGAIVTFLLAGLLFAALVPTLRTNGPSINATLFNMLEESFPAPSPSASSPFATGPGSRSFLTERSETGRRLQQPVGDWIRELSLGILYIAVLAYPMVFWICTFTRYYEFVLPSLGVTTKAEAPAGPPRPPPPPSFGPPPQL
jgi:hypothetical protein